MSSAKSNFYLVKICLLVLAAGSAFITGCSKSKKSSTGTVTAKIVVPGVTTTLGIHPNAAGDYGQNTLGGLVSAQFYITRISLCPDLKVEASGYTQTVPCADIYTVGGGDNAYETYKIADASTDTGSNWIDMMSASSLAAVSAATATVPAGTYNYVTIEHRKPIKLEAQITTANGNTTLKTCTGGTVTSTGSDTSFIETTTVANMTTCSRAQMVMGTIGGGHWFKFQNPVTISADTSYNLDLAFDPVGAVVAAAGVSNTGISYKDSTYQIYPPQFLISPVLRDSTEHTVREQYDLSSIVGLTGHVVLNLYYAGSTSDVGTKTIVGADARVISSSTSTSVAWINNAYSVTTAADGTISVLDYQGHAIVSGLTRSTTTTTGGTSNATVDQSVFSNNIGTGSVATAVTFNGVTAL